MRNRTICASLLVLFLLAMSPINAGAQTAHFSYAQLTLVSGFDFPDGIAVDHSGNVFVADTFNNNVDEIPNGCLDPSCVKLLSNSFDWPFGIAVDASGNVFVADNGYTAVKEILAASGYATVKSLAPFPSPYGIAVDANSNVFFTDNETNKVQEILAAGGYTTIKSLGSGFNTPASVAVDSNGNVFVADTGSNAVKEILAASGYTTVNTLGGGFNAPTSVALDASGNIFVADTGNGALKQILAVGGYTTVNTLSTAFGAPVALAADASGNLFVADTRSDSVLKLETTSADFGTVAVGQPSATVPLTFVFDAAGTIANPVALTQGAAGLDFAIATGGTCTAAAYNAGDTCTVNVTFTPMFAGLRTGVVLLQDVAGNTIATAYLHGVGSGPQVNFQPGTQSAIATNLAYPAGVAVDATGSVYIALATTGNAAVYKQTPSAGGYTQTTVATGLGNTVGVAVDGGGNVYIADIGNAAIYKETSSGGNYIQTTIGSGWGQPQGVAVDVAGNVYVADFSAGAVYKETLLPSGYIQTTIVSGLKSPQGVAVDGNGNVYIADFGAGAVYKATPSGATYTLTTIAGGLTSPAGVTVDASGNLYIVYYANTGDGGVWKETWSGSSYIQTTLASGLRFPSSTAVDGSGNVYIAVVNSWQQPLGAVYKVNYANPPNLTFPTPTPVAWIDATDGPQTVTIQNVGNAPLTFQPFVAANLLDAVLASSGATDCTVLTDLQLTSGAACTLGIEFAPAQSGLVYGHVNVVDNALNAAAALQTVTLQGTGIATAPAVSLSTTSLAFGNVAVNTESLYQGFTLTNTGGSPLSIGSIALTGTNKTQFLISGNTCPASLTAGSGCVIHLHFYPNVTGPASAALTITDNANGSPQSVTLTGTGNPLPTVSLSTTSLAFGNVAVNTESAYQGFILTNTSGNPLSIGSVALTGTSKTQFLVSANTCPATLAAGAGCTIHLHFYPNVTGPASAALTITDNAIGSPQSVTLTGTATPPPTVSLSTTTIAFGNVTVKTESLYQPFTLTNTGGSPLTITGIALTGTNKTQFLISSNYCPTSLSAGANCTIHLHFYPTVTGPATAALTITDNATASPQSVTLTGTGK
jgi:sugar lactone lactonase YvrE